MRQYPLFAICAMVFFIGATLSFPACTVKQPQDAAQSAPGASGKANSGASVPKLIQEGYLRRYNFIEYGGRYYAVPQSEGPFSLDKIERKKYRESYTADSIDGLKKQIMDSMTGSNQNDRVPLLVAEGYKSHINIIRYQGKYYGLGQEEGPFIFNKVVTKQYKRIYLGSNPAEIDEQLH